MTPMCVGLGVCWAQDLSWTGSVRPGRAVGAATVGASRFYSQKPAAQGRIDEWDRRGSPAAHAWPPYWSMFFWMIFQPLSVQSLHEAP